jgi:transposase
MLTTEQINDLHRLYWSEHWPIRKIERHLNMGWKTIRKYLDAPAQGSVHRDRPSKLDPFKGAVAEWLEKDPGVSAAVIEQKLRAAGYQGGHSILREYVRSVRPRLTPKPAFVRMEPPAGERFEVDWGHFGAISYAGDMRKLYAFALVDAHSRMLYVEFTHSQSFGTFARCHMHAFTALGGIARQIAYDNLATAVVEHDGRIVRFLPRFLAFAREYGFFPHACNPASGWEKGKIERAIGYLRQNFWPLREFTDLHDINRQARQWLADFEWNWPSKIERDVVERALTLDFLTENRNLVLLGRNGVGKTMIAQNVCHSAVLAGTRWCSAPPPLCLKTCIGSRPRAAVQSSAGTPMSVCCASTYVKLSVMWSSRAKASSSLSSAGSAPH